MQLNKKRGEDKLWKTGENVVNKSRTSHEQIKKKSWTSHEPVINKLWKNCEQLGAKLGQAQLKMELELRYKFDFSKKITNGHIDWHTHCLPLSIRSHHQQLPSTTRHFGHSKAPRYNRPPCVTSNCHKTTTSHPLTALYPHMVNFKLAIYLSGVGWS